MEGDSLTDRKMSRIRVILFGLMACLLYGIGAGLRADIGVLLEPICTQTGLAYDSISFCIALMQLVFGASQPVFGVIAAKRGNRSVLVIGSLFMIAGLLGLRSAASFATVFGSLSILFGLGTGAISFGLVFTSAAYFVGQQDAMLISGMLNAAAGMTGFIFAPLLNRLLESGGVSTAMLVMAGVAACMIPFVFVVTSRDPSAKIINMQAPADGVKSDAKAFNLKELVKEASSDRTYRLLVAGFSTCGFHMVIIESHLFSQFKSYGIPGNAASWAFSIYSVATICGALLSGVLSTKVSKGKLLCFYYGFRAVWVCAYLFLMPKNIVTAVLFAIGLGMTGDATVSPTSGLVNEQFSIEKVASLVGFLFLCHQIGAFFSAWLGGILLQSTGGYVAIWMIDIVLCLFASFMSGRIPGKNNR